MTQKYHIERSSPAIVCVNEHCLDFTSNEVTVQISGNLTCQNRRVDQGLHVFMIINFVYRHWTEDQPFAMSLYGKNTKNTDFINLTFMLRVVFKHTIPIAESDTRLKSSGNRYQLSVLLSMTIFYKNETPPRCLQTRDHNMILAGWSACLARCVGLLAYVLLLNCCWYQPQTLLLLQTG